MKQGALGIRVIAMPFINGQIHYEDDLTQKQFYEHLAEDIDVSTSQPSPGEVNGAVGRIAERIS